MRLSELVRPDCVKVPLDAASKKQAVFELADLVSAHAELDEQSAGDLREAVWKREMTRTTGIGQGIAIPHGKSAACQKLAMAIGKPASPIAFDAIDHQPVDLIILLASPLDQTGPHIQILASISRMLTDDSVRAAIKKAESAEEVCRVIQDYVAKSGG